MYKTYSCLECECKLWSDYSRSKGICPECEVPDEEMGTLEEQFEKAITSIENFN